MKRPLCAMLFALGTGWSGTAPVAHAQQGNLTLAEATAALDGESIEKLDAAIEALGLLGTKPAIDALIARARRGMPRESLMTAIFTLGASGDLDAGTLLAELTSHRVSEVRARAVETLAALQWPGAVAPLLAALGDPDAEVRSAAAIALGEIKAPDALEPLFRAHDRGNPEAALAIGKVVTAAQLPRLLATVGTLPLTVLTPTLQTVLRRNDLDETARMTVVARLSEMATREVKQFLLHVLATHGSTLPARLRTAITTAAQQIAD